MRTTAIVVSLALVVLFVAGAMAQEVIIDAGANVGGSEDVVSPPTPTIDLEAAMTDESQSQPQAGPSGLAGEDGRDGAPGRNGRDGRDGRDAQLPKDWSRQSPRP